MTDPMTNIHSVAYSIRGHYLTVGGRDIAVFGVECRDYKIHATYLQPLRKVAITLVDRDGYKYTDVMFKYRNFTEMPPLPMEHLEVLEEKDQDTVMLVTSSSDLFMLGEERHLLFGFLEPSHALSYVAFDTPAATPEMRRDCGISEKN